MAIQCEEPFLFPWKVGTCLSQASLVLPDMKKGWMVALINYDRGICRYEEKLLEPQKLPRD